MNAGTVTIQCPVCDSELHVPLTMTPTRRTSYKVTADLDYLRAHWLTHNPHDGHPLPIAA